MFSSAYTQEWQWNHSKLYQTPHVNVSTVKQVIKISWRMKRLQSFLRSCSQISLWAFSMSQTTPIKHNNAVIIFRILYFIGTLHIYVQFLISSITVSSSLYPKTLAIYFFIKRSLYQWETNFSWNKHNFSNGLFIKTHF